MAQDLQRMRQGKEELQTGKKQQKGKGQREKKRALAGLFLLLSAVLLLFAARSFPNFATWYSLHIYKALVSLAGRFFGIFPISVSEFLLYILAVFFVFCIGRTIREAVHSGKAAAPLARFFSGLLLAAGILFFIYAAACGVNYYRTSFAEETSLEVEGGTVEELKEACRMLTDQVNETASEVYRDESGQMKLTGDVQERAVAAMEKLGEKYDCLEGEYPRPKGLVFSWILSVQKLTGIYSPFTIEANYNTEMTDYNIPFTACHELAHLKGFMQEQEANFIGYLAALESDDTEFQYSGALLGWIYCTNALQETDYEAYREIRSELCEEAEVDLEANSQFWQKYESPVAEVANEVNDTYLKANGQQDGVVSYDRMVELILAYNRQQNG